MVVSKRTSSIQTMEKTWQESENFVLTEVMPLPSAMKRIADGRTLLPELSLRSMMAYFATRKVRDGQNAGDFKHVSRVNSAYMFINSDVSNHSYPYSKDYDDQENENNVQFNAVCLPQMCEDRWYISKWFFLLLPRFSTPKMAVPREEDLLGAVNILQPFAMPLRSLSDLVLHSSSCLARRACKRAISHD